MVKSPAWFYAVRSEQLSIVYLTRRDDLRVIQPKHEYAPDLLVTLLEGSRDFGRYMGVETRGVSTSAVRHADKQNPENVQVSGLRMNYEAFQNIPFPLCLYVFSMEDDRGYWKWIREPVLDSPDNRTLVLNEGKTMLPLTNEAIEQMVQTVRCWYGKVK